MYLKHVPVSELMLLVMFLTYHSHGHHLQRYLCNINSYFIHTPLRIMSPSECSLINSARHSVKYATTNWQKTKSEKQNVFTTFLRQTQNPDNYHLFSNMSYIYMIIPEGTNQPWTKYKHPNWKHHKLLLSLAVQTKKKKRTSQPKPVHPAAVEIKTEVSAGMP